MARWKQIVLAFVLSLLRVFVVTGATTQSTPAAEVAKEGQEEEIRLKSIRPYLLSLSVADLDQTLKWYESNLGFTVLDRKEFPKLSLRIAFLQLNGFTLEVIEFKNSVSEEAIQKQFPNVDDRAKIQGFGKLAFSVDNIEAFAKQLKSKGVNFVREVQDDPDLFHTKWFIVTDNSGNWIQFFQRA